MPKWGDRGRYRCAARCRLFAARVAERIGFICVPSGIGTVPPMLDSNR